MDRPLLFIFLFTLSLHACQKKETPPEIPITGLPPQYIMDLDRKLKESSGLAHINQQVWTHNDSDGAASIYQIDMLTGTINYEFAVKNGENIDWEDLAADQHHLYIGDIGNNYGFRKTMTIYQLEDVQLEESEGMANVIRYTYPDQPDTTALSADADFDCEALVVLKDSLYLFTKRRSDLTTNTYAVPIQTGMHEATQKGTFDVGGLVTAADYAEDHHLLCLLAYNKDQVSGIFVPFIWLFYDFPGTQFFEGKQKKIDLMIDAQFEGICYQNNGVFLLSTEKSQSSTASLFEFDALKWIR